MHLVAILTFSSMFSLFSTRGLFSEATRTILFVSQMHISVSRITYRSSSNLLNFLKKLYLGIRAKAKLTGSKRIILVINLIILILLFKEEYLFGM